MRLLLLSNSASDAGYLVHALDWIRETLGDARTVAFVPYAGVTISYDDYADRVRENLAPLGLDIRSVHEDDAPARAASQADAVLVGGGNTFQLLRLMYRRGLIEAIRKSVRQGKPYVGWSAGANVACPTIQTTNDMPIVVPPSMEGMGLVPFQINAHYTDAVPAGHRGETRAERIAEYVAANPDDLVVGMPEGTGLRVQGTRVSVLGTPPVRLFTRNGPASGAETSGAYLSELVASRR